MPSRPQAKDTPSSVTQLAAAMAALGLYGGANTPAEHAAEARHPGGNAAHRLRLVNALLGVAQAEALTAASLPVSADHRLAAYEQQLATAGVAGSPTKRIRFLRWQTLRVAGPLREMAQHVETGPIPLAAAHAAEAHAVWWFSYIVTLCSSATSWPVGRHCRSPEVPVPGETRCGLGTSPVITIRRCAFAGASASLLPGRP